ncbi:MAG: hypothetical protein IIY58_02610 [Aeriscardovia sp.]|nr:hypothetical protein [Aeriscardovia sp.]
MWLKIANFYQAAFMKAPISTKEAMLKALLTTGLIPWMVVRCFNSQCTDGE